MELGYLRRHHTKKKKKNVEGTSLVVQWLRLHLPMQALHAGSVPGQGTKIPTCLSDKKKKKK